jgi:predicted DCC family thiol-disulfide oxidoreductase YuxK
MKVAYPLSLYFDGACPLCISEMTMLKSRDASNMLTLIDVSAPAFDVNLHSVGALHHKTLADLNALIHATDAAGRLLVGIEVFRAAYGAVGLGHWWAITAWPGFEPLFNAVYAWFAAHRTGLSKLAAPVLHWLAARRAVKRTLVCKDGACVLEGNVRRNLESKSS